VDNGLGGEVQDKPHNRLTVGHVQGQDLARFDLTGLSAVSAVDIKLFDGSGGEMPAQVAAATGNEKRFFKASYNTLSISARSRPCVCWAWVSSA
jgi:hypothetical protein